MNIVRLNEDTLRVDLSVEEQTLYGIKAENIKRSDLVTRRLCEKILSAATEENLFKRTSDTVTVKAKQTKNGLTLWIENTQTAENAEYLYQTVRFDSLNSLLDAIPLFKPHRKDYIYSSLYRLGQSYYLYFEIFTPHEKALRLLRNLLEYGERTSVPRSYLSEHGSTIRRDDALDAMLS